LAHESDAQSQLVALSDREIAANDKIFTGLSAQAGGQELRSVLAKVTSSKRVSLRSGRLTWNCSNKATFLVPKHVHERHAARLFDVHGGMRRLFGDTEAQALPSAVNSQRRDQQDENAFSHYQRRARAICGWFERLVSSLLVLDEPDPLTEFDLSG
jgi:hypothetical protein